MISLLIQLSEFSEWYGNDASYMSIFIDRIKNDWLNKISKQKCISIIKLLLRIVF